MLLGASVRFLSGQQTVDHASVSGRVTDPSGAVIQGAQVSVRNADTNAVSSAETDRDGRFRFSYLQVGRYLLTVSHPGFASASQSLTLTVGSSFEIPVSLGLVTKSTNLTVTAEAAVLEAARSQIAGTVQQAEIRSLPLNGRNLLDVALLIPGVSPTNTGANQLFAETAASPGQGISIDSQRNLSNSFVVDGLSDNDDASGLTGAFYGLDIVNEFQVVTSGGQAEFGRALGGYVNIVTKSGTNSLHGDAYGYLRNQRFDAA
ncbi:MAG: carboxypeptidase regulatory-like domain-containing protein, partial [Acidobacteriaceae bacterium]|nr:carboxypeptidase regulatory-like domain-containing protein [Acidobacteriaceae bacterium]